MMGVGLGRKDILALVIIVSQLISYILEKVKARERFDLNVSFKKYYF